MRAWDGDACRDSQHDGVVDGFDEEPGGPPQPRRPRYSATGQALMEDGSRRPSTYDLDEHREAGETIARLLGKPEDKGC
jgi:hypothetical protein